MFEMTVIKTTVPVANLIVLLHTIQKLLKKYIYYTLFLQRSTQNIIILTEYATIGNINNVLAEH